jgi:osmotically-inducible protein OsmY
MNVTESTKLPIRNRSLRGGYAVVALSLLATMLVSSGMSQDDADKAANDPTTKPVATKEQPVITQAELHELTDELIMLAIDDELRRSEAVDGHRIDVDVDDGIVTLSGHVSHLLAKEVAVGLAERVRGVVAVLDEMEVNTDRRENAALKKDVVDALSADPATHRMAVNVVAEDNIVTLSGTVPSNGEKTLAGEVAMRVKGVIELKNELEVEPKKNLTDKELQAEISELYKYAALLDDVHLEVQVKDGVAVLNGRVASSFQKSYADLLAYRAGAKKVDSRGINVNWRHTNPLLRAKRYEQVTDEDIRDAIQRAFKHDPRLLSFDLQVDVQHGVVTLTGDVGHLTAQLAAEQDARHTIGVQRVKNNLRVRWPDKAPSDEQIADFTRAAMARDPYVERHNLNIECENAHVSLYGLVDTQFEKYHAEWIASRQKGVVHVNDYLSVRTKWKPKSDATIEAELKDKLTYTFVDPNNQVTATVENGVAILRGTVDTWYMWQTALDQAIAAGAREPHILIEVRYGLPSGPHYYGPHDYVPR